MRIDGCSSQRQLASDSEIVKPRRMAKWTGYARPPLADRGRTPLPGSLVSADPTTACSR